MNAKLRCLLDDLRSVIAPDCAELTAKEANELYVALQLAGISLDAAMCAKGEVDWQDENSRKLR